MRIDVDSAALAGKEISTVGQSKARYFGRSGPDDAFIFGIDGFVFDRDGGCARSGSAGGSTSLAHSISSTIGLRADDQVLTAIFDVVGQDEGRSGNVGDGDLAGRGITALYGRNSDRCGTFSNSGNNTIAYGSNTAVAGAPGNALVLSIPRKNRSGQSSSLADFQAEAVFVQSDSGSGLRSRGILHEDVGLRQVVGIGQAGGGHMVVSEVASTHLQIILVGLRSIGITIRRVVLEEPQDVISAVRLIMPALGVVGAAGLRVAAGQSETSIGISIQIAGSVHDPDTALRAVGVRNCGELDLGDGILVFDRDRVADDFNSDALQLSGTAGLVGNDVNRTGVAVGDQVFLTGFQRIRQNVSRSLTRLGLGDGYGAVCALGRICHRGSSDPGSTSTNSGDLTIGVDSRNTAVGSAPGNALASAARRYGRGHSTGTASLQFKSRRAYRDALNRRLRAGSLIDVDRILRIAGVEGSAGESAAGVVDFIGIAATLIQKIGAIIGPVSVSIRIITSCIDSDIAALTAEDIGIVGQ